VLELDTNEAPEDFEGLHFLRKLRDARSRLVPIFAGLPELAALIVVDAAIEGVGAPSTTIRVAIRVGYNSVIRA
jgi:hypothetical protein